MRISLALLLAAVSMPGCSSGSDSKLDADRILRMAGDEAGLIAAPKDKLTRELNVADRQADTGKKTEARQTLALARQTLEKADKEALSDQQRLAGWISLSELARKAEDKAFANAALDQALKSLEEVNPQQARCQYVLGVEQEVRELRGDKEAAKLLTKSGDWAIKLAERSTRRAAYLDFAKELFECQDYDGARDLLRRDEDAAWRSDSLMAISDRARSQRGSGWFGSGFLDSGEMAKTALPGDSGQKVQEPFSKRLDFGSNYQR